MKQTSTLPASWNKHPLTLLAGWSKILLMDGRTEEGIHSLVYSRPANDSNGKQQLYSTAATYRSKAALL